LVAQVIVTGGAAGTVNLFVQVTGDAQSLV
jgi:hypothetical protein